MSLLLKYSFVVMLIITSCKRTTVYDKLRGGWEVVEVRVGDDLLMKQDFKRFYGKISFFPNPGVGKQNIYLSTISEIDIIGSFTIDENEIVLLPRKEGWAEHRFSYTFNGNKLMLAEGSKKFVLQLTGKNSKEKIKEYTSG